MAKRITLEEFGTANVTELRNVARTAIEKRLAKLECLKVLGKQIAMSVAFDDADNSVVVVAEKNFDIIH